MNDHVITTEEYKYFQELKRLAKEMSACEPEKGEPMFDVERLQLQIPVAEENVRLMKEIKDLKDLREALQEKRCSSREGLECLYRNSDVRKTEGFD